MSTIGVWMIVVLVNSGHRVELPNQYSSEPECLAAAQALGAAHVGGGDVFSTARRVAAVDIGLSGRD